MALAETAQLAVELNLGGNFNAGIATAQRNLAGLSSAAQRNLGQIGRGTGQVAAGLARIGAVAATAAAGGLLASTRIASNFSDQMQIINTLVQGTPERLNKIGDGIRGLARNTGASLDDLTAGYYDLLSAGIKVEDAQGNLDLSYRLSRGALSTTAEAVDFLTTAINAYGLSQGEATVVADQFAQAVADGKVKLSEIAGTFSDVAAVAKTAGLETEEIAAAYAFLTAKGVGASEATTQMNRAIIELLKPGADLEKLQKKLHKNYADLAAQNGLVPTLEQMRKDADRLGIPFQNLFGRLEGYKFALQTTGPAFADFQAEQEKIVDSAGALNKQYDARQQGLNYQLGRLKANVKDAGLAIGTGLAPAVGRLADRFTKFLSEHTDDFVRIGKQVGDALDGIDWDAVGDGARTFYDVLKSAWDIVKLIPPQIDAAVLGFAGLNKVSGGLLGQGLSNILEGSLKLTFGQFFQRGSSPANPLWVASVGGGIGGGGVGGKGGTGGVLGLLGFLGIAGATVAGGQAIADAIGATPDNPVSGASRAFYRNQNKEPARRVYTDSHNTYLADAQAGKLMDALEKNRLAVMSQRGPQFGGKSPDERDQERAITRVRDATERSRIDLYNRLGDVVTAIHNIPAPTLVVSVSDVQNTTVKKKRTGGNRYQVATAF